MIEGLKRLVDAVHDGDSKIVFQLVHSGRQTTKDSIGQTPLAPSKGSRDNIYMVKSKEMDEEEIQGVIKKGVKSLIDLPAEKGSVWVSNLPLTLV